MQHTSNGIMVRPIGPTVAAGAVARFGDGGTFGQTNNALILLQRAGQAVDASQRLRDMVANNPAFREVYTSDYSRTPWTEPKCLNMVRDGASVDDIVTAFEAAEEKAHNDGAPKAAQPRKKDMEAALLNGTEDALKAALVMKDRVAVAMHNAKHAKIAPDVKRFREWLLFIVKRDGQKASVISPPSHRAMRRMMREYIDNVKEGISVLNAVKAGLDEAVTDAGAQALNQQPSNAAPSEPVVDPLAPMTCIKPEAPASPVEAPELFVGLPAPAKKGRHGKAKKTATVS